MLPVAGDADLQVSCFLCAGCCTASPARPFPTMPGGAKHIAQDPKYLEKFIGADDDLEDFEVEPDVFYGVCPPASAGTDMCERKKVLLQRAEFDCL